MRIAVDTNVLVRSLHRQSLDHTVANNALESLRQRNEELLLFTQVACEWWAVVTRPLANNGLGLSVTFAEQVFETLRASFVFVPDPTGLIDQWFDLVKRTAAVGKNAHDARLAAAAILAGADALLTFNLQDFRRFTPLTVLDPRLI